MATIVVAQQEEGEISDLTLDSASSGESDDEEEEDDLMPMEPEGHYQEIYKRKETRQSSPVVVMERNDPATSSSGDEADCESNTETDSSDSEEEEDSDSDDDQDENTTHSCSSPTTGMGNLSLLMQQYQYDASRMQLTPQEHEWALQIKNAIENIPDMDPLTDFMYAQFALFFCKNRGNLEDVIARAYKMQEHKHKNDILDTLDQALRSLPIEASFLSIDYNLQTGGYIIAFDITKVDPATFGNPEQLRSKNQRTFYAGHMVMCDLAAVRAGGTILIECEGYKAIKGGMIDLTVFKGIWETFHAYPQRKSQTNFYHCPTAFKMVLSLAKKFLPEELTTKFKIVDHFSMGNLNQLYSIPSPEIAHARLQERMKELMVKRFLNEANFRL